MEAFVEKGNLFLLYSGLLKEKQRQIYEYHIMDDMSFTEIGLEMGITRQAAQAVFRKADEKLKFIEENLHLAEKWLSIRRCAEEFYQSAPVRLRNSLPFRFLYHKKAREYPLNGIPHHLSDIPILPSGTIFC